MKNHQKGFIIPLIILIIAVLAIGGVYLYNQSKSSESVDEPYVNSTTTSSVVTPPPAPVSEADSGITGTATVGPNCPGPAVQNNDQCADKPYSGSFDLTSKTGIPVKQFKSDANGMFKVALPSGEYVIKESNPKTLPTLGSVDVTVKPHAYTSVKLQLDSGIR